MMRLILQNANGVTVYWFKDKQESLAQTLNSAIQKKALLTNRGSRQQKLSSVETDRYTSSTVRVRLYK